MSATVTDPATAPGGMLRTLSRQLADGTLIEFEEAPVGFLTKAGEPRKVPWRAYFVTPPEAKRTRVISTTTLLDTVCPKDGLPPWAEARGIEGAYYALVEGDAKVDSPEDLIRFIRAEALGADGAKDRSAHRGLNVHALLEEYMTTGSAPSLKDQPAEHRGYIVALSKFLLKYDPEPKAVEQLVCHPEDGYAGRLDLRALIGGRLITVDAKTQERAGIYRGAHLQVNLYERGAVRCGDDPADGCMVVVFAADGEYRVMAADHDDELLDAALRFHRLVRPIDSACESANRAEKAARA